MTRDRAVRLIAKPLLFIVLLVPLLALVQQAATGNLSANPIEDVLHRTGRWGLRILLLSLAVTPLRRLTGWSWLIRFRRMVGLFAFFYLSLHFSVYVGLDQFFSLADIVEDVAERPFITVGFAGLMLLVPLALTSTKRMVKRLGGRRWARLHRAVYIAAALGAVHFYWGVKADTRAPMLHAAILAVLLVSRLPFLLGRRAGGHRRTRAAAG